MPSKAEHVRALFDVPGKYLGPRRFDIEIRVEAVQEFTKHLTFDRVLDIGCGNGAISLPLLPRSSKLTLLDISKNMLDLARQRIPPERASDVQLIEGEFLSAETQPEWFDLILCIGVLAHVDSPAAVIARVAQLAKPGSWVVLEFTDAFHFWGLQVVLYQNLLKLIRPAPYALNRLKRRTIEGICKDNSLKTLAAYRYGMPPIGASRFMDQEQMYRMTRYLYGPPDRNRNAWMGNQFIYLLQKA
jgi:2-polyprenyl-3-methyl-5-hydroxy-6-metoxy-1,4-benzoquinol methylase